MGAKNYTKEDLKRLMQEKKKSHQKRVDSPLASYDSKGQLSCLICSIQLKETGWTTHLISQQHKDVSIILMI